MEELINKILEEMDATNNPYFVDLRNKTFDKSDFIETQIQFFFAVVFFSRPMAAIAAKIPDAQLRLEIVRNVWEEHGEGDTSDIHGHTFSELLFRLGVNKLEEINKRSLWPAVRQFNTALIGACALDEYLVGASVLGIIEKMFSAISYWIGQSIVENKWLTKDQLIHYNLHEELDIKHAQDFFDVVKPVWNKGDKNDRYIIEQGLRLGAFIFLQLYSNLHQTRKQRIYRDATCFHSRA